MENKMRKNKRMVWIDLEMTGLNPEIHVILEIATIVTDESLNILEEGPVLAIKRSEPEMERIQEWSYKTHSQSGLLERSNSSLTSIQEAEKKTLQFLEKWIKPGEAPLCGNSVHQDRRFMVKEMQDLEKFLHYRIIDVSTLKELTTRWFPEKADQTPPKKRTHLALNDIRESIEELQWYRENIFRES